MKNAFEARHVRRPIHLYAVEVYFNIGMIRTKLEGNSGFGSRDELIPPSLS